MHSLSVSKVFVLGLLTIAPLASGYVVPSKKEVRNSVDSLDGILRARHHTEVQIAAKEAAAGNTNSCSSNKHRKRATPAPDEFGPWDSEEDEFGSWVDKRGPHHTEAQIAAKEAAAANTNDCWSLKTITKPVDHVRRLIGVFPERTTHVFVVGDSSQTQPYMKSVLAIDLGKTHEYRNRWNECILIFSSFCYPICRPVFYVIVFVPFSRSGYLFSSRMVRSQFFKGLSTYSRCNWLFYI